MTDRDPLTARRIVALAVPIALLAGCVLVVNSLSPSQVNFWIGETVNHCPDSEFSCPSTRPGVLTGVMLLVLPFLIFFEDRE